MKTTEQQKTTFAFLGALLFLIVSLLISVFISSVAATTMVSAEQNGSRLITKAEGTITSYQWQVADSPDGEFEDIVGADSWHYDINESDEGKYIKAIANGTETNVIGPIGKLVIFDLSLGSVTFGTTYSGNNGAVTGTHVASNIYVVKQSNTDTYSKNIIKFSGTVSDPFDVTLSGIHLGSEPITTYKPNTSATGKYTEGVIDLQPGNETKSKKVILRLKGENIVRAIHYYTNNGASSSSLKITDINGDKATDGGSLYVPVKVEPSKIDEFVNSNTSYNHWNSGIGGDDSTGDRVTNFEIAGGKLQVLTTYADNCTAIGAGGNGPCTMTISGGEIVAHCSGTGTAIGGGIGWFSHGGTSNITISGGRVYAKNHGQIYVNGSTITTADKTYDKVVGGVAIGSGSSFEAAGSEGKVTITGGHVEAYGTFGNGIGGGNSSLSTGGKATINISGGTVIASSIGGGDSKSTTGGAADVSVSGTADITLIKGIGGGNSMEGNGGNATITVSSGTMTAGGSIGGGKGGAGNGGDATVNINGGKLSAASIGGGTGGTKGNGGAAKVYVTDGTIVTGTIGGGDTENTVAGKLGYALAEISGGDITGQFLMAEGGTNPCTFTMTGGTLHGVDTADTSKFAYKPNGAAVYMDDSRGVVEISGGTIKDCSAQNGGSIYMSAGTCTISDAAIIENCEATENGGAIYMGGGTLTVNGGSIQNNAAEINGGAVYIDGGNVYVTGGSVINNSAVNNGGAIAVNNGNYKMSGGSVDSNSAKNGAGGGIFVSADGHDVTVDVLSGSVSKNTAKGNGGAFAVVGKSDGTEKITVTVGVNETHFDVNGQLITNCEHGSEGEGAYDCPVLSQNKSGASGGGIYVTGNTSTVLNIFCLEESGSQADGDNGQSHFMKMDGGKVTIATSEQLDENNQTSYHGNTHIQNEVYVTGGQMDLWGAMTNPRLEDIITVDITKKDDYFKDHRENPESEKYYKLLYFENFTDPITNVTTGQYKEVEVKHGDSVTISGNIYSHPGYTITGWNTSNGRPNLDDYPQGTYNNDRGWYKVGDSKLFDGTIIGDLTIYAIWEANGYTVVYNPNVPSGETYTGKMENFNFTYDLPIKLSKNQYRRPGYEFVGWCKDSDGSSKVYADEEMVTNLTTKKGEVVTLFAQWKECDHNPTTHNYSYSVVDNGKTLKRECSCGKYSEEARLSAENTTYNKKTHPATIVYTSDSWKPTIVYEALDGDALVDGLPYHAGNYKVSVTENGYTASVTYTIAKADQSAPPKPVFDTNKKDADGSILSVKPVANSSLVGTDDTYTSYPEYRIVYYESGVEKSTEWAKGAETLIDEKYAIQFTLDKALTNYYIQARYSECDNYNASPESVADSVYFFVGNVEFVVVCGEGVKYIILTADGTDVTVNGIQISISTEDGYFFPIGYKATIQTEKAENNAQAKLSPENVFSYTYSIGNIPKDCKITLTLPDAQKNLEIDSHITEKQVFGKFSTNTATISRDSAYTMSFLVSNFSDTEYDPLEISFSSELPEGTTIIMQDNTNGTYYWMMIAAPGTTKVLLTDFIRMGDQAKSKFVLPEGNMDLQLVIDFSQAEEKITGDTIVTTISAATKANSRATAKENDEVANLRNESTYELFNSGTIGEITFLHTKSEGAASKWDNRDDVLVFIPRSKLPADAHLSIVCGDATTVVYSNCEGNFVYSMPDIVEGKIVITLISHLLPEGSTEYAFDVEWIVAKSIAEQSPMNAACVADAELLIEGIETIPVSLKISGDKKLYALNETVKATVSWDDLPSNHNLEVVLMVKTESGDYSSTAVTEEISFNGEEGTQEVFISLAGNNPGSYRLYLFAELGLVTVAEAEYYFIVE
ncbi:MAG: InlB B-repeat-containing protein [Tyzzerella sp.]|nr:InlB B-repeat-containing protein [Tyzzerella sp.]